MGEIEILPAQVADQIAAGEVVERPASVLRELLDNALDAGATRVEVELEAGGIDRLAVADDGKGMSRDDAVLAFERHATSKIRTGDDLQAITTLGFRGEALAAIAAVARVELVTAPRSGGDGTRVLIERGQRLEVGPAARAVGTTVVMQDLFGAIPARRKFLKTAATELDHCLRTAQRLALARPQVAFRVRQAERVLIDAPSGVDLKVRIGDLLGSRWSRGLIPVDGDGGSFRLSGFVVRSDLHRFDRDGLHTFVNQRPVRDPLLMRAIQDAYRNLLPSGAFPVVVLHLSLPPNDVDVNVHPAKAEVRFARPQEVRALVVHALRRALGSWSAVPEAPLTASSTPLPLQPPLAVTWQPPAASPASALTVDGIEPPAVHHVAETAAMIGPAADDAAPQASALAQYGDCFILAQDRDGLLIVDQHVAHERLLYEGLLTMASSGPLARQRLLFPATLELTPAREEAVAQQQQLLERLGFGLERLGGGTVLVREVPTVFGKTGPAEGLERLLQRLEREGRAGAEVLFDRLLATIACHTAVRKGMALGLPQMNYILRGLQSCDAPTHCPHGRVVSLRLTPAYLDRAFGRT